MDYLMEEIVGKYGLEETHSFVQDRTRSIKQDFTLQNIRGIEAVEIHERIARYHILCLHELNGSKNYNENLEISYLEKGA
jgi:nuclear mRNA export protein SAC3